MPSRGEVGNGSEEWMSSVYVYSISNDTNISSLPGKSHRKGGPVSKFAWSRALGHTDLGAHRSRNELSRIQAKSRALFFLSARVPSSVKNVEYFVQFIFFYLRTVRNYPKFDLVRSFV